MLVRSVAWVLVALLMELTTGFHVFNERAYAEEVSAQKVSTQSDGAFKVSEVTCWDVTTLAELERTSALLLIYGFVAGKNNLDLQSSAEIQRVVERVGKGCADQPDQAVAVAMQSALEINKGVDISVQDRSPVEVRLADERIALENPFSLTPHQPNYILPATFSNDLDFTPYGPFEPFLKDSEVKFQLSLKSQLASNLIWGSYLEVGYTQVSYWQLYADEEASAPFRETNYQPELMWRIPLDFEVFGLEAQLATLAFTHQSNGQIRPLSRSWNRVSGELVATRGNWVLSATAQTRVDDPEFDDNPNVEDFMGRLNIGLGYKYKQHTLALGVQNGMGSRGKVGAEFNWIFPLTRHLNGIFQVYHGYGENLIDMEHKNTRVGVGVALNSWF